MSARVLVMGTGGVGGYFGAALARAGHDVAFVARGPNLEALRSRGLHVTGALGEIRLPDVRAFEKPSEAREQDLVLMCVKSYDLQDACSAVRPCGGVVLTLQNGVDAARRVRDVLGDVALAGCTGIVADLAAPGHVDLLSKYAWIRFGEPSGEWSDRTARVSGWLAVDGIEAIAEADVRPALWSKMANICAMAGLTTLTGRPIGDVLSEPSGRASFRRVIEEVEAVARAQGVELPDDFADTRFTYALSIEPDATSSMSRDFARGRRIELETLNGAIVRLGAEAGVAVPVNEAVYAGIKLRAAVRPT